jgi:ABC-type phosphonate transport system ATPase subunit
LRTGNPQIPARADLALDLYEDLPASLIVVKELFTHLLAVHLLLRQVDLIVNDGKIRSEAAVDRCGWCVDPPIEMHRS